MVRKIAQISLHLWLVQIAGFLPQGRIGCLWITGLKVALGIMAELAIHVINLIKISDNARLALSMSGLDPNTIGGVICHAAVIHPVLLLSPMKMDLF
jgi:hypothetical protein